MNIPDLINCYGTQAAAAVAIGVTPQVISKWKVKNKGRIPIEFQIQWEINSGGRVRADLPMAVREHAA